MFLYIEWTETGLETGLGPVSAMLHRRKTYMFLYIDWTETGLEAGLGLA